LVERCILVRLGRVRFSEDGEVVGGDDRRERLVNPAELPVLAERPTGVRVLVENEGIVRMLVFVERADLQVVSSAEVVLAPAPGMAARAEAGVRVAAGVPLEEKAQHEGQRKVAGSLDDVAFEGWVPESALGVVFERRDLLAGAGGGLVRPGAPVVASPDGAVIARFRAAAPGELPLFYRVEHEPGAPPGFQRVRYATRAVEVRGLVRAADFKLEGPSDLHHGGSIGRGGGVGVGSSWPFLGTLEARAPLFVPGGVARVGVALGPLRLFGTGLRDGGGFLEVELRAWPFHYIRARARAADVRPYDAERDQQRLW
jgi:hypothetical protein